MDRLVITFLLIGIAAPAFGQFREPADHFPPSDSFSITLGVTPYLEDLRAPSASEELPALIATPHGLRPVKRQRVYPSTLGGWLLQVIDEMVCDDLATAQSEHRCDAIGTRAYTYPPLPSSCARVRSPPF